MMRIIFFFLNYFFCTFAVSLKVIKASHLQLRDFYQKINIYCQLNHKCHPPPPVY